jgi:hypothetical protein
VCDKKNNARTNDDLGCEQIKEAKKKISVKRKRKEEIGKNDRGKKVKRKKK